MGLRILQVNMARSAAGMNELRAFLAESEYDIIQEPYVRREVAWSACRLYYHANINELPWTLIVIKNMALPVIHHVNRSM